MDDMERAAYAYEAKYPRSDRPARRHGFVEGARWARSEGEASSRLAGLEAALRVIVGDDDEDCSVCFAIECVPGCAGAAARALLAGTPDAPRTCRVTNESSDEGDPRSGWTRVCGKPLPCPDHPRDEVM